MEFLLLNFRIPKCNTVLQSENDLFEPEIQPNSPELRILCLFVLYNPQNVLGIVQLME